MKVCSQAAGAVVVASVVVVDPAGWYPFTVAKWWVVFLTVIVASGVAVRARDGTISRWPWWLMVTLVAVMGLAAMFGREPLYAWTGTPERHFGVLGWVVMVAAAKVGAAVAAQDHLERFTRWVVVAGGAAGMYALIERWWGQPVSTSSITERLGGPYGSASIFAAALCLLVPMSLAATVGLTNRWWRYAASLAAALCLAAVVGTGTRAAWVGLSVAATVALARPGSRKPAALTLGAGGLGALLSVLAFFGTGAGEVAQRSAGATSRLAEWGVGWRIIAANPWLGVGPEGYRTALADGVTAHYEATYGRDVLPDRAHNVLLDVAATGGVLAAAIYIALGGVVLLACWRAVRSGTVLQAGTALAVIAYGAQSLFLFPLATVDPVLWLLVGVLLVSRTTAATTTTDTMRTTGTGTTAAVVSAGVAAVAVFAVGIVTVAADRAARHAVDERSVSAAERAVALRPDVVRYRLLLAALRPGSIAGRKAALEDTAAALAISPDDPIGQRQHAGTLTRVALGTGEASDRAAARSAWQTLATADPNCYQCALGLGYALALDGEATDALAAFERAARLARPNDTEAAENVAQLKKRLKGTIDGT